jgi:serine/threonine-protein kinase RsbT
MTARLTKKTTESRFPAKPSEAGADDERGLEQALPAHGPRVGAAPSAPVDVLERISGVLRRYMTEPSVRAVVARADATTGTSRRGLEAAERPAFFAAIERAAAPFLVPRQQALLRGELEFELALSIGASEEPAASAAESVAVRNEWDVSLARARARELVTALGGKSYDVVKAMTLVSELARNIVLYTPGGRIDFVPHAHPPPGLVVRALDTGSGIPNLDEVLSGRYRSKTGLGKGLIGARRLAHRFEIQTDASGTQVEVEVRL